MKRQAFTLVEVLVGTAVSAVLATAIFALLNAGMILSAKNLSLNLTSNSMRTALDRVEQGVQMGNAMPTLIDTAGADVAAGSAAGIKFDRVVGSPYVVTLPAGGIPASATTLTLTRSTHPVASPPVPSAGDIILITVNEATLRARIQSVGNPVAGAGRQSFLITLTAPLGTAVAPITATIVSSRLVRNVAFLVKPANGKPELRYYQTFDTTTNLNNPAGYTVVTDQIGTAAADATPFSIVPVGTQSFVSFSLRVRASNADQGIRSQQRDQFNTYSRIETLIRPKTTQ